MSEPLPLAEPPARPQRVVFLGTPDDAVPSLRSLVDAGVDVALVVSGPDRRRGRRSSPTPTPVKAAALELGLPVTTEVADALDVDADLGIVVAFGQLIRRPVLELLPMLNVHFSLLPRWRGAAPVERAILAGDTETGVCIMGLEVGLDTGPVYSRAVTPIGADDTAAELRERLAVLGAELLVDTLRAGLGEPAPQEGEATHAAKFDTLDRKIDWSAPAVDVHRLVRIGGAWTMFDGKRVKVHEIAVHDGPPANDSGPGDFDDAVVTTGEGSVVLRTVQPEGKPRMDAAAWQLGLRVDAPRTFGE